MDLPTPTLIIALLDADQRQQAIAHCHAQIAGDPSAKPSAPLIDYWTLGLAWLLQGEVEQAQESWLAALTDGILDDPAAWAEALSAWLWAAAQSVELAKPAVAAQLYEQVIELNPDDTLTMYRYATVLAQQGRVEEAIALWQQALTYDPQMQSAYESLAALWQSLNQFEAAIATYQAALAQFPDWAEGRYQLGCCLIQQQQFEPAIACLQTVVEQRPDWALAYGELSYALLQQGQVDQAIAALYQGIQHSPQWATPYIQWVQAQATQGSASPAVSLNASLLAALQTPPVTAAQRLAVGQLLQQAGQLELARLVYQQVLDQEPGQAIAALGLGQVCLRLGDLEAAIAADQQAIALQPDAIKPTVEPYLELGKALLKAGHGEQAIAAYQQGIALAPRSAEAWLGLGYAWLSQGLWQSACDCYQQAIALQPDAVEAHCNLGIAWVELGHPDQAIAHLATALKLNGNLATQVSQILTTLGDRGRLDFSAAAVPPMASVMPIDSPRACYATSYEWAIATQQPDAQTDAQTGAQPDTHYIAVGDRTAVALAPPQTAAATLHPSFRFGECMPLPPSFVATLPDGRFWLDPDQSATAIITRDHQILSDLSPQFPILSPDHAPQALPPHWLLIEKKLQPPVQIDGTVAVLAGLSNAMYFHWIGDGLPRLDVLDRAGGDRTAIDYFLVSHHLPFQQEILARLGIPLSRCLAPETYPHLQARRLVVPSYSGAIAWMSAAARDFLRQALLPPGHATQAPGKRIYISRHTAHNRRIVNEAQVIDYLAQFGFCALTLETLSVFDQIAILAGAEAVISPHGGGLTNSLFCQPGTKIIEIFSPNYVYPCYWYLANLCGLEYFYVLGEVLGGRYWHKLLYPNARIEDIVVDLDALAQTLDLAKLT